jgi:hypothetical protein
MRSLTAWLVILLAVSSAFASEETGVKVLAEIEDGLYADTGRLSIRLTFTATKPIEERYQVFLQVVDKTSGVPLLELHHTPPVATDTWEPDKPVSWTVAGAVRRNGDGSRPAAMVLVGLRDLTLENAFEGRLRLSGEAPFVDRRYLVGTVSKATGRGGAGDLRDAARERAEQGRTAEAFDLLGEALARADDLPTKLAVTADLMALDPPPGAPLTGPEEVITRQLIAGERLRWLRDRASDLLKAKELRVALQVLEKIGGAVEEGRNSRVVGEPTGEERAKKDMVDLKYRLLRDLPTEEVKECGEIVTRADGDPKKLFAAAKAEAEKGRLVLARRLALEAGLVNGIPVRLKEEVGKLLEELEGRILFGLTSREQQLLEKCSDHPAFHRTGMAVSSRFVLLGPEEMVKAIPRASTYRLDVAHLLLTDLFGRSPVPPGERIFIYFKETYSGPATGGGRNITVGDADPKSKKVRVDNGLYYHELTHCVDDTRPVHDYKRGLTEGIANVGALFVADMFQGEQSRFTERSKGGRDAFKRHHLDRENAYWLIPAYAPSEGMLTEILLRHAMADGGHPDWPRLGRALRLYRKSRAKDPRTHRIMAHLGYALAESMGVDVFDTLAEFGFPVSGDTAAEIRRAEGEAWLKLVALTRMRDARALAKFADQLDPDFLAARARYAALMALDAGRKGDSPEAEKLRLKLGVVNRFNVIGPFYPEAGPGLAEIFPPERKLDLATEYVSPHGVARWRVPERGAEHYARIDGRGVVLLRYGYPNRAVTYALTHVTVPTETAAIAWLGADDEPALWVNGVYVQRNHGRRPLVPDWERWPVTLTAGRNRIVLKIANQTGGTGFCLRLTDAAGQPIEGLTVDLDPPTADPKPPSTKWEFAFRDVFNRRSLGRRYEVAAGKFTVKNKVLFGEAEGRQPGWRPFSVRPGFPQDRPAALLWLAPPKKEPPADFILRLGLAKEQAPRVAVTWDGEGDELPLSGWSLILTEKKGRITARLERYDYLQAITALDTPTTWREPVLEIKRIADKVTVTLGGTPIFENVSAPPLRNRRIGLTVWGPNPGFKDLSLAHPR